MFSGGIGRDPMSFNQDIGEWNVSSVIFMSNMFGNADSFNQDIGDWDVSKVTDMGYMFSRAESFDQDIGAWDVSSIISMRNMFEHSGFSATNYDRTLIGWFGQNLNADLTFGASGIEYCNSGPFRNYVTRCASIFNP